MADDINLVILCGTLGADPELRVGQSGSSVCKLRIATDKSVKKRGSDTYEKTVAWHSVVVFGKRGEFVASDCAKGDRVTVRGELSTRSYEKNGQKVWTTEIVADTVCHERKGAGRQASTGGDFGEPEMGGSTSEDDSIPF